jgi:hypothetical protein
MKNTSINQKKGTELSIRQGIRCICFQQNPIRRYLKKVGVKTLNFSNM